MSAHPAPSQSGAYRVVPPVADEPLEAPHDVIQLRDTQTGEVHQVWLCDGDPCFRMGSRTYRLKMDALHKAGLVDVWEE